MRLKVGMTGKTWIWLKWLEAFGLQSVRHQEKLRPLLRLPEETGLAAVQLASDFSLHKLPLDDISEWVGPADWDE